VPEDPPTRLFSRFRKEHKPNTILDSSAQRHDVSMIGTRVLHFTCVLHMKPCAAHVIK
jgi:hypothetical protein